MWDQIDFIKFLLRSSFAATANGDSKAQSTLWGLVQSAGNTLGAKPKPNPFNWSSQRHLTGSCWNQVQSSLCKANQQVRVFFCHHQSIAAFRNEIPKIFPFPALSCCYSGIKAPLSITTKDVVDVKKCCLQLFPKMSKTEKYLGFFPSYSVLGIHYCRKKIWEVLSILLDSWKCLLTPAAFGKQGSNLSQLLA